MEIKILIHNMCHTFFLMSVYAYNFVVTKCCTYDLKYTGYISPYYKNLKIFIIIIIIKTVAMETGLL